MSVSTTRHISTHHALHSSSKEELTKLLSILFPEVRGACNETQRPMLVIAARTDMTKLNINF